MYTTAQNKLRTVQTQNGYCSMRRLSEMCAHKALLQSQTEMRQMRWWTLNKPMPPKAKIEWCLMWKSSWELQELHGLQGQKKKKHSHLRLKIYIPPAHIKWTLYTQPEVTYAQITKQNSYVPTNTEQEPHINQSHQQTKDMQECKNMMKSLFEQMGTMLHLLTNVLTKLNNG
jgi:hypothetical protein